MNIKVVAFGLVIALVLSVAIVSALSNSGGGDWKYYKEITIKENSGKTLNDYQVLVELNPSNFPDKAKMDGSDLRFAEDGKELSYWIEDYDAGAKTAKIWVKVPSIPANGEAKIKMYYGNEKAGSVSDGDATFEFFDDFESGNLNKWSTSGGAEVQSTTVYQGGYTVRVYNQDGTIHRSFSTKPTVIEWYAKFSKRDFWGGVIGTHTRMLGTHGTYTQGDSVPGPVAVYDGAYHHFESLDHKWHRYKITITSSETKYYFDGDLAYTTSADSTYDTLTFYAAASGVTTEEAFLDQILVRKYTSSKPTVTLSQEFPTKKVPSLTLTKSASSSTIQEGETTIISIRIENTGTGDAKTVEVIDTIPTGFKIISGLKSASFDEIKPGDYRTFEYTLKATGSGKFTCEPATATYKDADGNSYSVASNSVSIQVGGEVPIGADSDGDGWSDAKEKEMGTNPYSVDSDGDGLKDPEDPNPTVPDKKTPGFEAIVAITGLLAVTYLLRRNLK